MAFVTLLCPKRYEQDDNHYEGKTEQTSTNESDSSQTYALTGESMNWHRFVSEQTSHCFWLNN